MLISKLPNFLSIQRGISGRSFTVHQPIISAFHFSFQCCMVCFLASSTFTVSPCKFLVSNTLCRSLACRPISITPLVTSIAEIQFYKPMPRYSIVVRCTDDETFILQLTFNASAQISLPESRIESVIIIINLSLLCMGPSILAISLLSKEVNLVALVTAYCI